MHGIVTSKTSRNHDLIGVIIPSHDRLESLKQCLDSVYRSEVELPYFVVVVLDTCKEGIAEQVRASFPHAIVQECSGDLWWSASINVGIHTANSRGATHLLFLNDDTVVEKHTIARLHRTCQDYPDALIGSLVLHSGTQEDIIWCAGGVTHWWGRGVYMKDSGRPLKACPQSLCEAAWLPGMGTMVATAVALSLGGMDQEHFPHYFGDADFSMRARGRGHRVLVEPKAVIRNDVEKTGVLWSSARSSPRQLKDVLFSKRSHSNVLYRCRFWLRHCPLYLCPWQAFRFYVPIFASWTKSLLLSRRRSMVVDQEQQIARAQA